MSGIAEAITAQIHDAVAELESEAKRDDLRKCNRRIGILTEQLKRQIAYRDFLALELGETVEAAAHVDELLDAVLPEPHLQQIENAVSAAGYEAAVKSYEAGR